MSNSTGIFLLGRSPAGMILAVLLAIVSRFTFWWWAVEVSLTARAVTALEVASVVAGAGVAFAALTRMASWDRTGGFGSVAGPP